jgi:uncharacterized alkaline shock family protein YloU
MTMTIVSDGGTVTVPDSVLSRIVVQAAESVGGTRVRRRRHVAIEIGASGTQVGVELGVVYGLVLPDVAREVQERVAAALGTMCGVQVTAVDVSIEELD